MPLCSRAGSRVAFLVACALAGCGQAVESAETERLRAALDDGDSTEIEAALAAGADPNTVADNGDSLLINAILEEDGELVRTLLEHGADPDVEWDGVSAIRLAIDGGDEIAIPLLDHDAKWLREERADLLSYAAFDAPQAAIRLLELGFDPNGAEENGVPPLQAACSGGHIEAYVALRAAGARGDASELVRASLEAGNRALVDLVLTDHPGTSIPDDSFADAVSIASASSAFDWLEQLVAERGAPSSDGLAWALWVSAAVLDSPAIAFLIRLGADPGESDVIVALYSGYLHLKDEVGPAPALAAYTEHLDLLIELGADVNLRGHDGNTALHGAIEFTEVAIVEALLARGAEPNALNEKHRYSPLTALILSRGDLVDRIMAAGEDGASGNDLREPAIRAMLIAAGADPNLPDRKGKTSLHHAGYAAEVAWVEALLAAGADRSIRNEDGQTAAAFVRASLPSLPSKRDPAGRMMLAVMGLDSVIGERRVSMIEILSLLGEPVPETEVPAAAADE